MNTEIRENIIFVDGIKVPQVPTKNRGGVIKAIAIVCHDTASGLKPDGDIDWLARSSPNSSAHVVIARDGKITQLAPMNIKTWHAGQSKWKGRELCNGFTLGLEIDNPGRLVRISDGIYKGVTTIDTIAVPSLRVTFAKTPQHGEGFWLAYSDAQIEAVTQLCRALVTAYPSIKEIITHWLISPGRKMDTNPLFPLEQIRDRVLGGADPEPVKKADKKIAAPIADATVAAADLNLRSLPGMDGKVLASLKKNVRIDVQAKSGEWLQVMVVDGTARGKTGFVFAKFVRLD